MDGLFRSSGHPFSSLPADITWNMKRGVGEYADIDYLLFTHFHPDHYSEEDLTEYLKGNRVRKVFLPHRSAGIDRLISQMKEGGPSFFIFEEELCKKQKVRMPEFSLNAFQCRHLGKDYASVRNLCYILEAEEKTLLFTADADYEGDCFRKALKGVSIDIVFVNPLFFNHISGREILSDILCPKKLILYHLPFEKDDRMRFRDLVSKDVRKYKDGFSDIEVLQDLQQTIFV